MLFLLSGEGATDMGKKYPHTQAPVALEDWYVGPMACFVNELCKQPACLGEDVFASSCEQHKVFFVDEGGLGTWAEELRTQRKRLVGLGRGCHEHVALAYALAAKAKVLSAEKHVPVIAVFFRDGDRSASHSRDRYDNLRESMKNGFARADFAYGVAMIPNPKSEAWLLCALKNNPYQDCDALENESGNDNSPYSLKKQLEERLTVQNRSSCREHLVELIQDSIIEPLRIDMPSFKNFRTDFESAVSLAKQS